MPSTGLTEKVNILLVDDQPSKLLTYETILSGLGENLIKVHSATEALECLLTNEIAVVLMDVCMPDLDGYELAAMIRQHPRFHRLSIIFVSAVMSTDMDRLRGYEVGAVDFVPVPVIPELLRAKVGVFAELYRKTRELERLNAELESRVADRTAALEASTTALREADRRKDEFLATLAHELRNPLAPIRTAVQLLAEPMLTASDRTVARDVIERQVNHLVTLVDDLLDVSRITRNMITLQRQPVSLETVVARAVETARPLIDGRRQTLAVDLPAEPIVIEGDETRLIQVVENLLHNATKFTLPEGRIELTVERLDGDAAIEISDTGIGIAAEAIPTIFELFTQLHGQSGRSQGLGIGLALVRRLTEMHGGSIAAHSDGPGRGTRFTVRLPLPATVVDVPAAESRAYVRVPVVPPRRIIVADDNHDAANALAKQLGLAGHTVQVVHDGQQALAAAARFQPDVVLLDLGMPELDGYETAKAMRLQPWGADVRLIALTGWGQAEDRQRTTEAGFDIHLVKPVAQLQLFEALRAVRVPRKSTSM